MSVLESWFCYRDYSAAVVLNEVLVVLGSLNAGCMLMAKTAETWAAEKDYAGHSKKKHGGFRGRLRGRRNPLADMGKSRVW